MRRVTKAEEYRFIKETFAKGGLQEQDAENMAQSLTWANMRGLDSHGIIRMPLYFKRLKKGLINPEATLRVVADMPSLAVCDAQNGYGQVIARQAMTLAIEKAKTSGIGMVAVRNSNHFGVSSEYSLMADEAGMFGIVLSNTPVLLPPTGGLGKAIGNNPICCSFPREDAPDIVVDMALSTVAYGKILVKQNAGQSVPLGWGVDKDGKDTTNPSDIINGGYMLPVGGPKGYGLAVAVEMLTSVLAGGAVCSEMNTMVNMDAHAGISHTFIAINYLGVGSKEQYCQKQGKMVADLKACRLVDGVERIYIPGEIESLKEEICAEQGIQISDALAAELDELALAEGVDPIHYLE